MSELYEHSSDGQGFEIGFDSDSIRALFARHRWLGWFLFAETLLLGVAGVVPLLGTSDYHYLLFGMVLSLAMLAAGVVTLVGAIVVARRAVRAVRRNAHT